MMAFIPSSSPSSSLTSRRTTFVSTPTHLPSSSSYSTCISPSISTSFRKRLRSPAWIRATNSAAVPANEPTRQPTYSSSSSSSSSPSSSSSTPQPPSSSTSSESSSPPPFENQGLVEASEALQRLPLKRVLSWASLLVLLLLLRSFFPVIVGTFILSYVTNSVVRAVGQMTRDRVPRRAVVGIFYAFIITSISGFSLMTIPTVVRESQYFISTLQSENPYVYVANSLRKTLGDELTTKVEAYVMYSTSPPESITATTKPVGTDTADSSQALNTKPSLPPSSFSLSGTNTNNNNNINNNQNTNDPHVEEWTEARSRRLGMLLQKSLRSYIAGTVSLITKLIGVSTKVVFKAILSLIFSFMIMWDLPVVSRGVRRLKYSRLSFIYDELAPVVSKFGSVLGKSFEAQGLIALVNTTLTTAGLIILSIPGVGFLSLVTLICSFIPVAGVFVSTFPMCIIALSEFGVAKAIAVIAMVIFVHIVEAYVLNPQIYSAHLHLHPLMVLAVLYIAEHSYGIPGLLLAVPVAVYILRTIMLDGSDSDTKEENGVAASIPVGVVAAAAEE